MNESVESQSVPLIVCADDAGFAERSDHAILRCFREGVVRVASVSVTQPRAQQFVAEASAAGLEVGLHLDLTEGPPLTGAIPGLAPDGRPFLRDKAATWALLRREPDGVLADALANEILAQWERLLSFGARPSHLNGHNHMHVLPAARRGLRRLMETHDVPHVRVPIDWADAHDHPEVLAGLADTCRTLQSDLQRVAASTAAFTGYGFSRTPTSDQLLGSLGGSGALEVMVHPGSRAGSPFTESHWRDEEARVLSDPDLPAALAARGFSCMGFFETLRRAGTGPS